MMVSQLEESTKGVNMKAGVIKYFVTKLEMMRSTLGRLSPMLRTVLHDNIVGGVSASTALERGALDTLGEARKAVGLTTAKKEEEASLEKIAVRIHGKDVMMTRNQIQMTVAHITDPQTLRLIRLGTDNMLANEEGGAKAVSIFKPVGVEKLHWYNVQSPDMDPVKTTIDPNTGKMMRPEGDGWINIESEQGIIEFLRSPAVTDNDFIVAGASKEANRAIINEVNKMWKAEYGEDKFPEAALPHTDDELQAIFSKRAGREIKTKIVFGYTPRRRSSSNAKFEYSNGKSFKEAAMKTLESLGVQKQRTGQYMSTPLIIDDIMVASRRNYGQLARIAKLQVPMRRALDILANSDGFANSVKENLETIMGKEFVEKDLLAWITEHAQLSSKDTEATERFLAGVARNVIIGRIALRITSLATNRYTSIPIAMSIMDSMEQSGRLKKGTAKAFFAESGKGLMPNKDDVKLLVYNKDSGYFWKRWAMDLVKVYTQAQFDEENIIPSKYAMKMQHLQNMAMAPFAVAEQSKAMSMIRALRNVGYTDAEIPNLVEEVFRQSENPSTKSEEPTVLRWMKDRNISFLAPYIGQTLVVRDLLTNSIMALHQSGDNAQKRTAAKRAIVASSVGILATMAASQAVRMLVRGVIKPEPEDEERERNKRTAMTMLQEASATIAPFGGDAAALAFGQMFGLAEKQFAESSMVASVLSDISNFGSVVSDAYSTISGTETDEEKKEWKDITKGAWKAAMAVSTAVGIPTAGGVDQGMQLIIERAFEPTKKEYAKRSAVDVMDEIDENTTREQFDSMLREVYKQGIEEERIDRKKTSFKEFKGRLRSRVQKKLGEDEARDLGYKRKKKEQED
jgi:hypothetical protein